MMKKTIIGISLLMAVITLSAQPIGTKCLYESYRGEQGVLSLYIPGFVMRLAGNLGDLEREEMQLLRSMRSVRVLTIENDDHFANVNFVKESRVGSGRGGYETMLEICSDGEDVKILVREKNGKVRDLLILVGGEENVLVHIRGRMHADMLGAIANIAGLGEIESLSHL